MLPPLSRVVWAAAAPPGVRCQGLGGWCAGAPVARRGLVSQPRRLSPVVTGAGQVVEAWVPTPARFLAPLYTWRGLAQRWTKVKKWAESAVHLYRIRSADKSFSPTTFSKSVAPKIYTDVALAVAGNQRGRVKALTTEKMFAYLKKKMPTDGSTTRLALRFDGEVDATAVVMRYIEIAEVGEVFAQVTVRVISKQAVAVFQGDKCVKGDLSTAVPVEEYVVFEKALSRKDATWKLAFRLDPPAYLQKQGT